MKVSLWVFTLSCALVMTAARMPNMLAGSQPVDGSSARDREFTDSQTFRHLSDAPPPIANDADADDMEEEFARICDCEVWDVYSFRREQVPAHMRTPKIVTYYRPLSCFKCASASILGRHNESLNVWVHVYGWFVMWVLALRFMMTVRGTHKQVLTEYLNIAPEKRAAGYTLPPAWPLIFFDALAGVFFFLSAWAHAFSCMDERLTRLFWMLEKAGITAGILGVHLVAISYLMYTSVPNETRRSSWVKSMGVVLVAGALAIGASWIPGDRVRDILHAVMIGLMIAYILVPMSVVLASKPCHKEWMYCSTMLLYLFCIGLTVAGAVIFALRIPERFEEGEYDFLGASHQILHVAIVLSVAFFHLASVRIWNYLAYQEADTMHQASMEREDEMGVAEARAPPPPTDEDAESNHERFTKKYGHSHSQRAYGGSAASLRNHESPFETGVWDHPESPRAHMIDVDEDKEYCQW